MKFKRMARFKFDTLFGRLALLIVVVLVLSHFSWLGILRAERRERQYQASVDQMAFQLQAFQAVVDGRLHVTLPDLVTETAAPPAADTQPPSDKSAELARQLQRRLPAGTQVRLESGPTPRVFVLLPHREKWLAMPLLWVHAPPSVSAVVPGVMVVLAIAIVFSLFAAWQIQRPVRALAAAAGALAAEAPAFSATCECGFILCAPEASDAMGMSLSVANTPADMDAAVASSSAERMVLRFTLWVRLYR